MRAILGQLFTALVAIGIATRAFVDTELNQWPVYAGAAFFGAFAWAKFWARVKYGRGIIVRPSYPEQPTPGRR